MHCIISCIIFAEDKYVKYMESKELNEIFTMETSEKAWKELNLPIKNCPQTTGAETNYDPLTIEMLEEFVKEISSSMNYKESDEVKKESNNLIKPY